MKKPVKSAKPAEKKMPPWAYEKGPIERAIDKVKSKLAKPQAKKK